MDNLQIHLQGLLVGRIPGEGISWGSRGEAGNGLVIDVKKEKNEKKRSYRLLSDAFPSVSVCTQLGVGYFILVKDGED